MIKKFNFAIRDYTSALEIISDRGVVYFNRAVAHHNLNEMEQACEDYWQAYKNDYPVRKTLLEGCVQMFGD
jgi:tetratricopeptide (TPR) repeat protein